MDPVPVCVCVMILLLSAPLSAGEEITCPCSEIPKWPRTESPPEECHSRTYRYSCQDGYVRKVGTSTLIKCKAHGSVSKWDEPKLDCIDDPKKPKPQPPNTTLAAPTSTSFQINQTLSTLVAATEERTRAPTPHDVGTPVTKNNKTTEIHFNPSPEALSGPPKAVIICSALFVLVCALIGIGCFLYRRARNNISQHQAEELQHMNDAPAGPH